MTSQPVYVIPSYQRADTIASKTLSVLEHGGVPASAVTVWVANAAEAATYRQALPDKYRIRVSAPRLRASRNHIVRAYPPGTRLLFCDDDLTAFIERDSATQLRPLTDIPGMVATGFAASDAAGARLWGLYPVDNARFMKPRVTTGLKYIGGWCYGITVHGDDAAEQLDFDEKEDYERTIRCYLADGATVRLEWIAARSNYMGNPGGMATYRTLRSDARAALRLSRRYPQLVTLWHRPDGRAELRLKDTRTPK